MNKTISFVVTFMLLLSFVVAPSVQVSAATNTEDKYNALFSAMSYNFNTGKIMLDVEAATDNYSFTQQELDFYHEGFASLSRTESEELLRALGVDLDALYTQTIEAMYGDGPQPRLAPIVIAALSFLGGAAAGKIIDEAMTYGIVKTCQKYKNGYKWFVDYCKTNGHI